MTLLLARLSQPRVVVFFFVFFPPKPPLDTLLRLGLGVKKTSWYQYLPHFWHQNVWSIPKLEREKKKWSRTFYNRSLHWGIKVFFLKGIFTEEINISRTVIKFIAQGSMLSSKCHFPAGIEMKLTEPVSVLKLFLRRPALVAVHGISFILVQCPAMCLVPNGGNVCPAVSLSWAGRVSTENLKGGL